MSPFEERLAQEWPATLAGGDDAAVRVTTAFQRLVRRVAEDAGADVVLIDIGPNLGALNRAALLLADHVLVPLGADVVSAQALRNLGSALRRWRSDWQDVALPRVPPAMEAPLGRMNPLGYILMRPSLRLDGSVQEYQSWLGRIPELYSTAVLGDTGVPKRSGAEYQIGTVRSYRSLVPLAHDAGKPMFDLRAADGAIGSTQRLVQICLTEFRALAVEVLRRMDVPAR